MSGKFIAAVMAVAVSSGSAATVGVVYTRILTPQHVEVSAPVGESSSGPVKSAVVLNTSGGLLGSFAGSSADNDAPACPGADSAPGCVVVARASNVRVNILGSAATVPPIWLGGDSRDTYSDRTDQVVWSRSDWQPGQALVIHITRRRALANGFLSDAPSDTGTQGQSQTSSQSQSGNQSQGSQDQKASQPNSISDPSASATGDQPVEIEFVSPQSTAADSASLSASTDLAWLATMMDSSLVSGLSPLVTSNSPVGASVGSLISSNVEPPSLAVTSQSLASVGVPAAPEPSTWAMMIAGAATLGLFKRRRIAAALKSAIG